MQRTNNLREGGMVHMTYTQQATPADIWCHAMKYEVRHMLLGFHVEVQ